MTGLKNDRLFQGVWQKKKMQIEEKCLKRTKQILTSVFLTKSKLKFDNKVNKSLERRSCLTSERNVIQMNIIVTY